MFNNRSRTSIAVCMMLVGTCSFVFGIDFSQALQQAQDKSSSLSSLFVGKSHISNLYTQALKIVQSKEVNSTTLALDTIVSDYICQQASIHLQTSDFINVLYNSNLSFKATFVQLFPKTTQWPTATQIDQSYHKFLSCQGISLQTAVGLDQIQTINNTINDLYYKNYSTLYMQSALSQTNFGSDLFWNGSLDDSDFDILYDINQLGQIFFESFVESPQVLFYRLPEISSSSSFSPSLSSLVAQSASSSANGALSSSSSSSNTSARIASTSLGTSSASSSDSSATSPSSWDALLAQDTDMQTFITTTNTPSFAPTLIGNQCVSGALAQEDALAASDEPVLMDPDEYIQDLVDFIETPNLDGIINQHLVEVFAQKNPLRSGTSTSDSGYAQNLANTYAEAAFGDAAPGTCEYSCKNLSLDKQALCELACTTSCIQTCTDTSTSTLAACTASYTSAKSQCSALSAAKKTKCLASAAAKKAACIAENTTDTALCVSDCTCFLIAGPNGLGWQKMEDMFRIKFCKVPVQRTPTRSAKKLYSIQAIFQEISDVLQGLRDSGQTTKFTKTKEFLDGAIQINFADNIAFKILVGFKPLFEQTTQDTKIQKQTQDTQDASLGILNMQIGTPEADDYTKYLIVGQPAVDKASMEASSSIQEIQQNIDKFTAAADAAQQTYISDSQLDAIVQSYEHNKHPLFLQNMEVFLKNNQLFRNTMMESLLDMDAMSMELKAKIEASE